MFGGIIFFMKSLFVIMFIYTCTYMSVHLTHTTGHIMYIASYK